MKSDLNLTKERSKLDRAVPAWLRHPGIRKAILLFLYTGGLALSFLLAYGLRSVSYTHLTLPTNREV